jgi:hypothetical protein
MPVPQAWLCAVALALAVPGPAAQATEAAEAAEAPSRFWSDDGWLDISGFLDQAYGFIPLVIPITEPAVGVGAVGALAFIDKQGRDETAGFGRPNITVVGALGTENGTRGAFAGDMRHWRDDRLKSLVGGISASVNLDFYGIGLASSLKDRPRSYNLDTRGGVVQLRHRLGDSQAWAGLGYALATTTVSFDPLPGLPGFTEYEGESRVAGLLPTLSYDSRDTLFTPSSGNYLEASAGLFSQALGSDDDFQRLNLTAIHYRPLATDLTLGLMASGTFSFGDVPFYLRPYIALRGAPVMRYQGESAAQVEAELRWQFWQRFSLVGFAGAGSAWNDFERFENEQNILTGGVGFRYEIASKYKLHMGVDVARGPDDTAVYIQVGSAWMRP